MLDHRYTTLLGLEPRLTVPKTVVLPLDYSVLIHNIHSSPRQLYRGKHVFTIKYLPHDDSFGWLFSGRRLMNLCCTMCYQEGRIRTSDRLAPNQPLYQTELLPAEVGTLTNKVLEIFVSHRLLVKQYLKVKCLTVLRQIHLYKANCRWPVRDSNPCYRLERAMS